MQYRKINSEIYFNVLSKEEADIDYEEIIGLIEQKIPKSLLREVDAFYVGDFDFLTDEHVLAKCMENAIYLSDTFHYESDVMDEIMIAISKKIIEEYPHLIYDNEKFLTEWEQLNDTYQFDLESHFGDHFADYFLAGEDVVEQNSQEYPETYKLIREIVINEV